MGYKLKTHSGASKRFKKTKRKRHNRGLNKMTGTVLKMASKLIK